MRGRGERESMGETETENQNIQTVDEVRAKIHTSSIVIIRDFSCIEIEMQRHLGITFSGTMSGALRHCWRPSYAE